MTHRKGGGAGEAVRHSFLTAGNLERQIFVACSVSRRATNVGTKSVSLPTSAQTAYVGPTQQQSVAELYFGLVNPHTCKPTSLTGDSYDQVSLPGYGHVPLGVNYHSQVGFNSCVSYLILFAVLLCCC